MMNIIIAIITGIVLGGVFTNVVDKIEEYSRKRFN